MTREAGVLLAISSLPSREGIGTLGEGAYAFVDFLSSAGFRVWQVLPLTPTREGNSPYSSVCENALNPLFIDLYDLVQKGLLTEKEIKYAPSTKVKYADVIPLKDKLLRLAFSRFDSADPDFVAFEKKGEYREYAVFSALSEAFADKAYWDWGDGLNRADPDRIERFLGEHRETYLYHVFTQYLFDLEWRKLKSYANAKGVKIFGDMPIYVAMNSAEVYFHPELFLFNEDRRPIKIAGVPPDYFNEEGQLWGNPLYDWEKMRADGFSWWRDRIRRELTRFDVLRIDHFRGLDRFYAIDVDATDAKHGVWTKGPGAALFEGLTDLPIVAEDLGYIDESLHEMLAAVGFPGMKVYEFGLNGDPWSEHKPANYKENVVAYTGTHDNMPFRGNLDSLTKNELSTATRDILVQATALSVPIPASLDFTNSITEAAGGKSVMQRKIDLLEAMPAEEFADLPTDALTALAIETLLSSKARLANTPALVSDENWAWRVDRYALTDALDARLRSLLARTKRML